ncbi:MAG TPA: 4-hydroxythreonine-4-phosphate dehydrogenase PdxA [bacterium]|nr:4-hydroxythreonine-4-phosphate dehydrogenase PdxA [bacterium]
MVYNMPFTMPGPEIPAESARRPALAVALGDPSGIGPEVLAKALAAGVEADVIVVGDMEVWNIAQRVGGVTLPAVPVHEVPIQDRSWAAGAMSAAAGRAAAAWLTAAVRLALSGAADAVVFAPLNKQAIIRAGFPVRDEYELCASLAGVDDHDEMNVIPHPAGTDASGGLLWVARATSHVPLKDVAALLTVERVLHTIRLAHRTAADAGTLAPRIGVAALNPHAGEGGLVGDEERRIIAPAIAAAASEGLDATGPHPADHVFRLARAGAFDVVVAMYHDQAQIATKLLGFERGVSVGVGYPFVMTTPSHGTAHDIAGRGIADPGPMRQALSVAGRLVRTRRR